MHRASLDKDKSINGTIGRLGFHCLTWSGKPGGSMQPTSTSSTFTRVENDNVAVRELRIWAQENFEKEHEDFEFTENFADFVSIGGYRTVVAQVIGVFLTKRNFLVIRAWDGTRLCHNKLYESGSAVMNKIDLINEIDKTYSFDENLDSAVKDYSVDIFVYDEHVEPAKLLKAGDYVKLGNLHGFYKNASPRAVSITLHGLKPDDDNNKYNRGLWKLDANDKMVLRLKRKIETLSDEGVIKLSAVAPLPLSRTRQPNLANEVLNENTSTGIGTATNDILNVFARATIRGQIDEIVESISRAQQLAKNRTFDSDKSPCSSMKTAVESVEQTMTEDEERFLRDYLFLMQNKDILPLHEEHFSTPDDVLYSQEPVTLAVSSPSKRVVVNQEQQTSQPFTDDGDLTIGEADDTFAPVICSTQKDYLNVLPRRSLR